MIPLPNRRPPLIQISNNHQSHRVRKTEITQLVKLVLRDENISAQEIHIILADDEYLRKLHQRYFDYDTPTDVMSFNLGNDDSVEGEIYISLDMAKKHAAEFKVPFDVEIARLIIHGLLHLKGYDDSTELQKKAMQTKEDYYLDRFSGKILL